MNIPLHIDARGGAVSRYVLSLLFMAAGGGIMAWYGPRTEGLAGWSRFIPYAMGGLFILGGARALVRELRRGSRRDAAERALKEHGEAPWRVRPEWRSNELLSEGRLERSFIGLTLLWNILAWPLAIVLIQAERGSGDQAVWLVALFPAIGLAMAGKLVLEILRTWKYGRTLVALDTLPLRLGGTCRGRMRVKLDREAEPDGGVLVRVSCYRQEVRYRRDSDGKRNRRIERDLLWRDEARFPTDPAMDGTFVEVPFAFTLPGEMPPSTPLKLDNRILWEISAEAAVPGIDFQAAVEVPVFPAGPGVPQEAEVPGYGGGRGPGAVGDALDARARDPAADSGAEAGDRGFQKPLSPGIVLVDEPDHFELHFTAARKRKGAVVLGIAGAVLLVAGISLVAASGLLGLIFLLMGGFMVYGSIQQGTNDTVLRVCDGLVSVSHDGPGMPADVQFPAAQVEEVVVDLATRSSENVRYAITLRARAGDGLAQLEGQADRAMEVLSGLGLGEDHPAMEAMREGARRPRIPVADDFTDKSEADWLAARIRRAMEREAQR